jgi:hypothetical protein
MSDLSQALVDAAAEAITAAVHRPGSRTQAREAVAAVLETLAAELPLAWTGLPSHLRGLAAEVKEERP